MSEKMYDAFISYSRRMDQKDEEDKIFAILLAATTSGGEQWKF